MQMIRMNREQAIESIQWRYPAPYAFYNTPESGFDEALSEAMEDNGMDFYSVLDDAGGLFGLFEYSFAEGIMEIGLGIRPDKCGAGHGRDFVRRCIAFGRETYAYSGAIRLMVADFNERAIHLYRALGFIETGRKESESFGTPVTFVVMELR